MAELTRETLIEAVKKTAAKVGAPLSKDRFIQSSGITEWHLRKLFPEGGWDEVVKAAGIARHPNRREPVNDDDFLTEFHAVVVSLGRIPTWSIFRARANVSPDRKRKRLGGLKGTLTRYRAWLEQRDPGSHILKLVDEALRSRGKDERKKPENHDLASMPVAVASDATQYGAPIDFRGLRHAPINEQGVVYLFGMVSRELGFLVEAIHTAYPDCEAKQCVDKKRDRWQRVRIEFEFRSRNFLEHAHDPTKCDLIVCWVHDWKGCPLEVVELQKVITELPRT